MSLRIAVNRLALCPDNIEFYIGFYRTADDAAKRLLLDCVGGDDDDGSASGSDRIRKATGKTSETERQR